MSEHASSPDRYARQARVHGIGAEGQARIESGSVLVVGCGALGCQVIDLLARAGVGSLTLVDRDLVEWTNLQRQTLFDERDAREQTPKALAAARRVSEVNASVRVGPHVLDVARESIEAVVRQAQPDVVADCTDNFETRYLLNDLCVRDSLALSYAGVVSTRAMAMMVIPGQTPCLRCVFPEPPLPGETETCETAGVLGPAVGLAGSWQAAAILRRLASPGERSRGVLLEADVLEPRVRTIELDGLSGADARRQCPACGERRFEFLDGSRAASETVMLCGSGSFQISRRLPREATGTNAKQQMNLAALAAKLGGVSDLVQTPFFVRFAPARGVQVTVFGDARAIVRGVETEAQARSVYDRFIGS